MRGRRSALTLLAVLVGAIAGQSVHSYVLIDACVGGGGRYLRAPARCEDANGRVRPLREVERGRGWALVVFGPTALAGALAYALGHAVTRRAASATDPDGARRLQ